MTGKLGLRIEDFTLRDNRPGWCSSSSTELRSELTDYSKNKPFLVRHWSTVSKGFICVFIIILWCLIFISLNSELRWVAIYLTFISTLVTFFEMVFVIHRLFCPVERKETCLHKIWDLLLGVTTWKKLLCYLLLTIPVFVKAKECPIALGCVIIIILIGLLDFIHLFRERNQKKPIRYQQLGVF